MIAGPKSGSTPRRATCWTLGLAASLSLVVPAMPSMAVGIDRFSPDARILAGRLGEGPRIDPAVTAEIESVLARIRRVSPELAGVHAFPDYDFHVLMVKIHPGRARGWAQGRRVAGEAGLDSLGRVFGLREVGPYFTSPPPELANFYKLRFKESLHMPGLARLYARSPVVASAEPSGFAGDGDRIQARKHGRTWHLVFTRGWGDCPAGCTEHAYWYAAVDSSGAVTVDDEWSNRPSALRHRWDELPRSRYSSFPGASALLDSLDSSRWWMRRQAIELAWRLLSRQAPWGFEVGARQDRLEFTREELSGRTAEVMRRIQARLNDPDADVRASAVRAIERLRLVQEPGSADG